MKSYPIYLLILLSFLTFSCTDNLNDLGVGIQPTSDAIKIATDTFHLNSENVFVDYMIARQDSFLLGTFYDTKYGSTQADILAQVNCPVGFKFPPNSVPDSALVVLYYKTWFGDNFSPMDVNIYEMNKGTFQYSNQYKSNLDPAAYTDRSILMAHRIFTAKEASKTKTDSTSVIFKLSNSFVNRFFPDLTKPYYTSESDFTNNFFKGMYITANYGTSTMLNIRQMDLEYYYHYTYNKNGKDTIVTSEITFPANQEVRQVNRFLHPDATAINLLLNQKEEVNYISSPANIQTRVNVPLNKIQKRLEAGIGTKKLVMNSAIINVEATEIDSSALAVPLANYMLLIKESAIDDFFGKNELPSDTCAILGKFTATLDSNTGLYTYTYPFNLAKLIANEIKIAKNNNTEAAENLKMRLIPVSVTSTTNSSTGAVTLTAVKQQHLMNAVTIKSGKNKTSPMRINTVYSWF